MDCSHPEYGAHPGRARICMCIYTLPLINSVEIFLWLFSCFPRTAIARVLLCTRFQLVFQVFMCDALRRPTGNGTDGESAVSARWKGWRIPSFSHLLPLCVIWCASSTDRIMECYSGHRFDFIKTCIQHMGKGSFICPAFIDNRRETEQKSNWI